MPRARLIVRCADIEVKSVREAIYKAQPKSDRPAIAEALRLCRLHKATLIIAKLDRLARNVHFISSLMESGADFIACDFPEANRLTVHILAAVAEHEASMISSRTKAALQAAKARGRALGGQEGQLETHEGHGGKGSSCERHRTPAIRRQAARRFASGN
jgi:DNA invertase Pin-like site-specific DNA recombinase